MPYWEMKLLHAWCSHIDSFFEYFYIYLGKIEIEKFKLRAFELKAFSKKSK